MVVERHAKDLRFTDDLTVLVLKRADRMSDTDSSIEAIHPRSAECG